MVSITRPAASALLVIASLCTTTGQASEGAASYYFAGGFGSFLTAVPPEPGFTAASQTLIFGGHAKRAVLRGRATFGLTASCALRLYGGLLRLRAAHPGRLPAGRRRRAGDRTDLARRLPAGSVGDVAIFTDHVKVSPSSARSCCDRSRS